MSQVHVITDSSADLPPEVTQALGITVLPVNIHFGNKVYRDGVDINAQEFFEWLGRNGMPPPSTTPPPASLFESTFANLMKETDQIIAIHASSKLSPTYARAQRAATPLLGRAKIAVIDSQLVSVGLGTLVTAAANAAEAGASVEELVRLVRGMIPRIYLAFFSETLDYLERGGRIRKAQAILGGMLNIKPLLILEDGDIVALEKVRTRSKAIEKLVEFIVEFTHIEKMTILHSTTPEDVNLLIEQVNLALPNLDMKVDLYGPALGTHLGPGALGVVVYEGM
ncbi:MAG: DegV family protein [Anaerolineae bacterium]